MLIIMNYIKKIILITLNLYTVLALSQDWVRTYSSTNGYGYGAEYVIESYDKGYVILGDANNYKYGVLIKTDINGNLLWKKLIGNGSSFIMPWYIEQTMDSGFIISGTMSKYGIKDAFILKLNSCFEKEWCKVLHTTSQYDSYGRRVKPLPDGGFLLLTAYYEGLETGSRIHLHRLSSDGELIWQYSYAGNDTLMFGEEARDLDIIGDSNYLITGYCFYPDPAQTGGWIRPYFIRIDSSGLVVWETIWGANAYFHGKTYNSAPDLNGNLYSIGLHIGDYAQYPAMVKTGPEGQELLYSDLVDTAYFGQGQTITFMEDSNLFIALGWKDPDQTLHNGFMKADTNGIPLGYHEVVPLSNALISTAKTFDNKFITVGTNYDNTIHRWVIYAFKLSSNLEYDTIYNTPFVYDSLCPYGITSDTTDLDCDILVNIDEVPPKEKYESTIKISPNPTQDWIMLTFPDNIRDGKMEIAIYNLFGQEVLRKDILSSNRMVTLDVSGLSSGLYVVVGIDQRKRVLKGKFVVAR